MSCTGNDEQAISDQIDGGLNDFDKLSKQLHNIADERDRLFEENKALKEEMKKMLMNLHCDKKCLGHECDHGYWTCKRHMRTDELVKRYLRRFA